jgi:hypothetical protein
MADKIQLEIVIDPEGNVRIETEGLKGEDCLLETKGLEAAIGEVAARTKNRAYYQKSASSARTRTGQR